MSPTNFDRYLDEQLRDPAFAEQFQQAGKEWDIALQLARWRSKVGISQAELAARAGTTQQQISRLEKAGYRGSLSLLERVASALGLSVDIRLTSRTSGKAKPAPARRKPAGKRLERA